MSHRVAIAGLGLIGGSLGMALRRRGWDVAFVDPNVEPEDALARGAASRRLETIPDDVELVVLATPVDVALRAIAGWSSPRRPRWTSACSVMAPLARAARSLDFVAGHPFAGSHERGLAAARADLFEGRRWFIERRDPLVEEAIAVAGATALVVDPEEHDRAMAYTSHLPQLLSTALAALLAEKGAALEPFYGSGLATFLRLAGSDASVWSSVFDANRRNVAEALDALVAKAATLDRDGFAAAQQLWRKLQS